MNSFDLNIKCQKCNSTNIHICSHLDYNGGVNDDLDYTGDIVLVCQDCNNTEIIHLKYEKVY